MSNDNRNEVLDTAKALVNKDRNNQYGPPIDDFAKTAAMWTVYVQAVLRDRDALEPHDVAAMMSLLKISRIAWSPDNKDNWIDLAGYAACGWDCALSE